MKVPDSSLKASDSLGQSAFAPLIAFLSLQPSSLSPFIEALHQCLSTKFQKINERDCYTTEVHLNAHILWWKCLSVAVP